MRRRSRLYWALMPAWDGGSRLGRSECPTRSKCFGRGREAGRRECAGRSGYDRLRLLRAISGFDRPRRLLELRDHSCRHVRNDRRRRRLVCGQTGVGAVARQHDRVEPKDEQTDYDRKCEEQADCASIDTLTGLMTCLSASHRAYDQVVCPPRFKPRGTDDSELVDRCKVTSKSVSPNIVLLQGACVNWAVVQSEDAPKIQNDPPAQRPARQLVSCTWAAMLKARRVRRSWTQAGSCPPRLDSWWSLRWRGWRWANGSGAAKTAPSFEAAKFLTMRRG
jgi:hypothetical protein